MSAKIEKIDSKGIRRSQNGAQIPAMGQATKKRRRSPTIKPNIRKSG